jgi:hypothetical protein
LDANVWLFIFCPMGQAKPIQRQKYSIFYSNLLNSRAPIFIPFTVISEFANKYIKFDFEDYIDKNPGCDFKRDYRMNSTEYKTNINNLNYTLSNQILSRAVQINDQFDKVDVNALFRNIHTVDFNDSHIAWLAKKGDMMLVTDDSDYLTYKNEIDILTINQHSLRNA